MLLAAFGVLAVAFLVFHDRIGARAAQLEALRLGSAAAVQGEPLAVAAAAAGAASAAVAAAAGQAPVAAPTISGTDAAIEVGQLSRGLIFMVGQVETAATWGVDPEGIVILVPGEGLHSRVQVKGVKSGTAQIHASTSAHVPARYPITVTAAKADPKAVTFLVLGSGIGAFVIAIIAVGLTASLGFAGKLSTETIAVVLGAAVGAGATAAASRSSQSPTADKESKTDT